MNIKCSSYCISCTIYRCQRVFSGCRLQGDLMEILRLRQISVIKMPKDGGSGITMGQFGSHISWASIHLLG